MEGAVQGIAALFEGLAVPGPRSREAVDAGSNTFRLAEALAALKKSGPRRPAPVDGARLEAVLLQALWISQAHPHWRLRR